VRRRLMATSTAVLATAVAGGIGTDVRSRWYDDLDKPDWQPPGWAWLFFTVKQPPWALAEVLVLEASTLDLIRRARAVDGSAAATLAPYAGWVGFASALNADIARRNS
jgi:translocator protein